MKLEPNGDGTLLPAVEVVKKENGTLFIDIVLPPKAAALFLAACQMNRTSPEKLAMSGLHSEVEAAFYGFNNDRSVADAFALKGKEEA